MTHEYWRNLKGTVAEVGATEAIGLLLIKRRSSYNKKEGRVSL